MKVTRFNYPLETNLIGKLDLMIERCTTNKSKKDNLLNIEGAEGEGKTTFSVAIAYYVSEKTGREFTSKNLYFDLNRLIKDAKTSENKIFIWDEPALQALSTDQAKSIVKDLSRLLMMARKKRHFFIFNLAKFYKFNEYIVVDRPMGMIHCYSRRNIETGRFTYYPKKKLQALFRDWRFKKKRNYKIYASKYVRGSFPDVLSPEYKNNVLSEFDINDYEKRKDKAIESICSVNIKKKRISPVGRRELFRPIIREIWKRNPKNINTKDEMGKIFGYNRDQISKMLSQPPETDKKWNEIYF